MQLLKKVHDKLLRVKSTVLKSNKILDLKKLLTRDQQFTYLIIK